MWVYTSHPVTGSLTIVYLLNWFSIDHYETWYKTQHASFQKTVITISELPTYSALFKWIAPPLEFTSAITLLFTICFTLRNFELIFYLIKSPVSFLFAVLLPPYHHHQIHASGKHTHHYSVLTSRTWILIFLHCSLCTILTNKFENTFFKGSIPNLIQKSNIFPFPLLQDRFLANQTVLFSLIPPLRIISFHRKESLGSIRITTLYVIFGISGPYLNSKWPNWLYFLLNLTFST